MLRAMRTILQALYMPGVIVLFPAVEGLRRDTEVAAGEAGIMIMEIIVLNHLSLCLAFLDSLRTFVRCLYPGIVL